MPLQFAPGKNYVKIDRVYVDSGDRDEGTVSKYKINLTQQIEDVVGIAMTSYLMPSSATPTFLKGTNDKVDFRLSAGALTKDFTFFWPSLSFTYQNVANPYLSYVNSLFQSLNVATLNDPDFGTNGPNFAIFEVLVDVNLKTNVIVRGFGITNFQFLFASGPNNEEAANVQMGFPTAVDTPAGQTSIVSPNRVQLDPYTRVEIRVDEVKELQPLDVIYNTNSAYFGTVYNSVNVTRTQLLTEPIRNLKSLTISLTIDGQPIVDQERNNHCLSFTIFSLSKDPHIPEWAQLQGFTL